MTRIPGTSPARTTAAYHDLWFFRCLIHEWAASGHAALTQFAAVLTPTDSEKPLWTPSRWTLATRDTAAHAIT